MGIETCQWGSCEEVAVDTVRYPSMVNGYKLLTLLAVCEECKTVAIEEIAHLEKCILKEKK